MATRPQGKACCHCKGRPARGDRFASAAEGPRKPGPKAFDGTNRRSTHKQAPWSPRFVRCGTGVESLYRKGGPMGNPAVKLDTPTQELPSTEELKAQQDRWRAQPNRHRRPCSHMPPARPEEPRPASLDPVLKPGSPFAPPPGTCGSRKVSQIGHSAVGSEREGRGGDPTARRPVGRPVPEQRFFTAERIWTADSRSSASDPPPTATVNKRGFRQGRRSGRGSSSRPRSGSASRVPSS